MTSHAVPAPAIEAATRKDASSATVAVGDMTDLATVDIADMDIADMADDLAGLFDALDIRGAHLLGLSMRSMNGAEFDWASPLRSPRATVQS